MKANEEQKEQEMSKVKINDSRLTPDMKRTRSGSAQMFRKDYGDRKFTDKDNADVILKHENSEVYAELIDEEWYWVKGCSKCKDSMNYGESHSYMVCHEHNVCVSCGTNKKDLLEIPYGHRDGFMCKPCASKEAEEARSQAFIEIEKNGYDEFDFKNNDDVKCPHCGTVNEEPGIYQEGQHEAECHLCGGGYYVEAEISIMFSTTVKGERLTK